MYPTSVAASMPLGGALAPTVQAGYPGGLVQAPLGTTVAGMASPYVGSGYLTSPLAMVPTAGVAPVVPVQPMQPFVPPIGSRMPLESNYFSLGGLPAYDGGYVMRRPEFMGGVGLGGLGVGGMANAGSLEQYADILEAACKGVGTDEDAIIGVIANTSAQERAMIRRIYAQKYGKDLITRLEGDLSGDFQEACVGCFMTPAEFDAYELHRAMKGLGTKEGVLSEIIGSRTPAELQAIKQIYAANYGETLENAIAGDTSGDYQHLLLALLQGNRAMGVQPDLAGCRNDAALLYQAGEGKWGTDEAMFTRIFATRSPDELYYINNFYTQQTGGQSNLLKAIDGEFSGDMRDLLKTCVQAQINPPYYFAERIHDSMAGLGTNDSRLTRNIIARSEIDMPQIKQVYRANYGTDLLTDLRGDTSGNYRKLLYALAARDYAPGVYY